MTTNKAFKAILSKADWRFVFRAIWERTAHPGDPINSKDLRYNPGLIDAYSYIALNSLKYSNNQGLQLKEIALDKLIDEYYKLSDSNNSRQAIDIWIKKAFTQFSFQEGEYDFYEATYSPLINYFKHENPGHIKNLTGDIIDKVVKCLGMNIEDALINGMSIRLKYVLDPVIYFKDQDDPRNEDSDVKLLVDARLSQQASWYWKNDSDLVYANNLFAFPIVKDLNSAPTRYFCPIPQLIGVNLCYKYFRDLNEIVGFSESYGYAFEFFMKEFIAECMTQDMLIRNIENPNKLIGVPDILISHRDSFIGIQVKAHIMDSINLLGGSVDNIYRGLQGNISKAIMNTYQFHTATSRSIKLDGTICNIDPNTISYIILTRETPYCLNFMCRDDEWGNQLLAKIEPGLIKYGDEEPELPLIYDFVRTKVQFIGASELLNTRHIWNNKSFVEEYHKKIPDHQAWNFIQYIYDKYVNEKNIAEYVDQLRQTNPRCFTVKRSLEEKMGGSIW